MTRQSFGNLTERSTLRMHINTGLYVTFTYKTFRGAVHIWLYIILYKYKFDKHFKTLVISKRSCGALVSYAKRFAQRHDFH